MDKQGINSTQCARARAILRSITGNLEVPGGETLSMAGDIGKIIDWEALEMNAAIPASQREKQLGADMYPFILITGSRFMPMYHSEQRQIERARKKHPNPVVTIHPSTAEKLGLAAGDWAVISTPSGNIRQKVGISDSIREDMVDLQHGWWFPESEEKLPELFRVFESNANILCPDGHEYCSQETGSWPHTALLCRIEKESGA